MSVHHWLRTREYASQPATFIMKRAYSSMKMFSESYDFNETAGVGAIFNLEFNADGNILVAACEKKAVSLYSVVTRQQICCLTNAHTDNVNCIKFLDDRLFASGSDDETVALWDLRYLKEKLRVLHGHSSWVKNIEYSPKDQLLVTSGFDGSIFTWDIKSQTEHGLISQKVFHTSGLMRCRISPDGEKLVVSTSGGYLMIIHHLDLTTLHKDLCGFRPSMYRLMQMGEQFIPQAAKYDHVFSKKQKKNRVELVSDFPENDDAEMIGALQIHPQGMCILSRNTCCNEESEWTCVHDINEEPFDDTDSESAEEPVPKRKRRAVNDNPNQHEDVHDAENTDALEELRPINPRRQPSRLMAQRIMLSQPRGQPPLPPLHANQNHRQEAFIPDIWAAEVTVQERAIRQNSARNSTAVIGYNFVYALSSGVLPVRGQNSNRITHANTRTANLSNANTQTAADNEQLSQSDSNGSSTSSGNESNTPPFARLRLRPIIPIMQRSRVGICSRSIPKNAKKLMYYVQESNQDSGFIKEPCFSNDGRIICSPYGKGLRLFSYTQDCAEYPRYQQFEEVKRKPTELVEVANISNHNDFVYCTKFSPREPLLVSGCQGSRIIWYHPNL